VIEPIIRVGPDLADGYQYARYQPFRGANYGEPKPGIDLRLLICGESNYAWDGCTNDQNLTSNALRNRLKEDAKPYRPFDEKISQAVLGREVPPPEHRAFWESVSFYNLYPYSLRSAEKKDRPTPKQLKDLGLKIFPAFKEVLEKLRPQCVLIFGNVIFDSSFPTEYDRPDPAARECVGCEGGWYETGSGLAFTVGIDHPNCWRYCGHNYQFYHQKICRAFGYARRGYPG
jgi:hypothetical protein